MDFSRDEYETLLLGLDAIARGEANALAQHGVAGLRNGRAGLLGTRLTMLTSLSERIQNEIKAIDDKAAIDTVQAADASGADRV